MDRNRISEEQERMEANIKAQINIYLTQQANSINGMMRPELVECNYEEKTLRVAFPVLEWEKNRVGALHGGVIAAAFDIATGLLARYLSGESFSPTIQLETVFIRPIALGDVFEIVVKTNLAGRKLTHMYCEGFVRSTGKLAATSTASYLNENTNERPAAE